MRRSSHSWLMMERQTETKSCMSWRQGKGGDSTQKPLVAPWRVLPGDWLARCVTLLGLLMLLCREKIGEWPEGTGAPGRLLAFRGAWRGGQESSREVERGPVLEGGSSECGGWLGVWARRGRLLGCPQISSFSCKMTLMIKNIDAD